MLSLIPLFPLVGFLINGSWYAFGQTKAGSKKAGALVPGLIATLAIATSFFISVLLFTQLGSLPEEARNIDQLIMSWMRVGDFSLDLAFHLDPLSSIFTLLITGVGTLIHIYSIGYMGHDGTPGKFFAYLNLFCFSMLVLILGSSLPVMFFGWEGVGLCSYLLIGYWYQDMEKASAGKKAFIVNRVGDFGFLLGMFLIFSTFNTLDFGLLREAMVHGGHAVLPAGVELGTITAICLLLFVGCTGKSAQFPLYIWLPDAMAGPTPVSALIHAATMVTSGVYLIARLNFMFSLSSTALMVIACVGAFTAFFAATIAFAQNDIKKVLAYSTVSQLGYMFLACGVGAYTAGVFHVLTHGFFKALLFLGAGSVIHGMHEEQDILKMGGLKSKMPKTFAVFTIGWLAICGLPPFSGFFSKDEILWMAFSSVHGNLLLWVVGAATAVMTAFYMTRMYSLTFFGKPRFDEAHLKSHDAVVVSHPSSHHAHGHDSHDHGHSQGVHESPSVMVVPLMLLALLSAFGGFMGIPHMSWLGTWLAPVVPEHAELREGVSHSMEWILMGVSVAGAAFGMFFAFKVYSDLTVAQKLKERFSKLHKTLTNKWYVDEFSEATIVKPIHHLSVGLHKGLDVGVIDNFVVGLGRVSEWFGQSLRLVQSGSIQVYGFMILIGLVLSVGYLVYGMV